MCVSGFGLDGDEEAGVDSFRGASWGAYRASPIGSSSRHIQLGGDPGVHLRLTGGVLPSLSSSLGMPLETLERDGIYGCGGGPSGIIADIMTKAPRAKKNGWAYEQIAFSLLLACTHWHNLRYLMNRFHDIKSNVISSGLKWKTGQKTS